MCFSRLSNFYAATVQGCTALSEGFLVFSTIIVCVIVTELISNNSNAVWRDMEEGKCRCLMQLKRHEAALDCANQLVSEDFMKI